MKSLFRKRTSAVAPAPGPTYSWCETVTAGPMTPQHIRLVGPEGLKHGGGVKSPALCGRDLGNGWDLETKVTPELVRQFAAPREGDGRVFACRGCAEVYLAEHAPSATP